MHDRGHPSTQEGAVEPTEGGEATRGCRGGQTGDVWEPPGVGTWAEDGKEGAKAGFGEANRSVPRRAWVPAVG